MKLQAKDVYEARLSQNGNYFIWDNELNKVYIDLYIDDQYKDMQFKTFKAYYIAEALNIYSRFFVLSKWRMWLILKLLGH